MRFRGLPDRSEVGHDSSGVPVSSGGQRPEEEAGVLDHPESPRLPTCLPDRAAQASGADSGSGAATRAAPMLLLSSIVFLSATPRASVPDYYGGAGKPR